MTIHHPRCTVLNFLEVFQYYPFKQVQIRFRGFASFWTPNSTCVNLVLIQLGLGLIKVPTVLFG